MSLNFAINVLYEYVVLFRSDWNLRCTELGNADVLEFLNKSTSVRTQLKVSNDILARI